MARTNYLWDAVNDTLLLETDEAGNNIAEYTHEPGQFGPLISQRRDGQTRYHHYDGQRSTRALTDEAGNVTDRYIYDAWGNELARTGTTPNPFGYKGELGYYANPETDDLYVRARTYDPRIARWLAQDPIGYHGSDWTLYEYASNTPIERTDPSGLASIYSALATAHPLDTYEQSELAGCNCGRAKYSVKDTPGYATVICNNGKFEAVDIPDKYLPSTSRFLRGLWAHGKFYDCVREHEKQHIEQMKVFCKDACDKTPPCDVNKDEEVYMVGWLRRNPPTNHPGRTCGQMAECQAYLLEAACILDKFMTAIRPLGQRYVDAGCSALYSMIKAAEAYECGFNQVITTGIPDMIEECKRNRYPPPEGPPYTSWQKTPNNKR